LQNDRIYSTSADLAEINSRDVTDLTVPQQTNRMRYHKTFFCIQLETKKAQAKIFRFFFAQPVIHGGTGYLWFLLNDTVYYHTQIPAKHVISVKFHGEFDIPKLPVLETNNESSKN
jgi:hypothetical protein